MCHPHIGRSVSAGKRTNGLGIRPVARRSNGRRHASLARTHACRFRHLAAARSDGRNRLRSTKRLAGRCAAVGRCRSPACARRRNCGKPDLFRTHQPFRPHRSHRERVFRANARHRRHAPTSPAHDVGRHLRPHRAPRIGRRCNALIPMLARLTSALSPPRRPVDMRQTRVDGRLVNGFVAPLSPPTMIHSFAGNLRRTGTLPEQGERHDRS